MSWSSAAAAGLVATAVLTSILGGASALGWTRIDIPFILGSAVTSHRLRAKWVGSLMHFVMGVFLSFVYAALFSVLPGAGIVLGAFLGLVHALLVGTVLLNVVLPPIHPRMGTPLSAANSSPLLEPPGFMLLNYGRSTPAVTIVAHVLYGALLGWFLD